MEPSRRVPPPTSSSRWKINGQAPSTAKKKRKVVGLMVSPRRKRRVGDLQRQLGRAVLTAASLGVALGGSFVGVGGRLGFNAVLGVVVYLRGRATPSR